MKKIKKSIAVFAVLLLMSSGLSVNAVELTRCEISAVNFHNDLLEIGISHDRAYALSAAWETLCTNGIN